MFGVKGWRPWICLHRSSAVLVNVGQNLCFNEPSPELTSLLHVNFQTSYESIFIHPPFLFFFGLALMKIHQIYWLLCLGINDLWRGIISETYKAQGLWWALNSSSAVSADSLAQKGKKNKLTRAWFCWEYCWESWAGQGVLGSKANGGRGMRV